VDPANDHALYDRNKANLILERSDLPYPLLNVRPCGVLSEFSGEANDRARVACLHSSNLDICHANDGIASCLMRWSPQQRHRTPVVLSPGPVRRSDRRYLPPRSPQA
jgi:hypothetical protein